LLGTSGDAQVALQSGALVKLQPDAKLIDISGWQEDTEFTPYPVGARSKIAVFSPKSNVPRYLIADHRYLFKHSNSRYPAQFWAEIAAIE
jgi:hypothetical protein